MLTYIKEEKLEETLETFERFVQVIEYYPLYCDNQSKVCTIWYGYKCCG